MIFHFYKSLKNPTEQYNKIKFIVSHHRSRTNFSSYKREKGGFYVLAAPIMLKGDEEVQDYGNGFKLLLEEAERFNKSKVASYAEQVRQEIDGKNGLIWEKLKSFLSQKNLEI
jgi:hypothetical protein